ncbi:hypothetical protein [Serratia marcescens]|uniref:hypothetical protein n=1 Tax=Serratia marcescens TaxID=615 RepID=UPI0029D8FD6D|nr:hypothetical protein [Serratia marcescens]MDX7542782.1 hypothetical protein [Serratia marcescens]
MMGTVYKLKGVRFNNPDLPNINPFVSASALVLGYEFKYRNFTDIVTSRSAKTFSAPYKGAVVESDTWPPSTSDGMGVNINEACIDASVRPYSLNSDGSTPITFMIVAGRSGGGLNSGGNASPFISPLLNWGNDFGNGAGLMIQFSSTGNFGVRYNNQSEGNAKLPDNGKSPGIYFVTYDGVSAWTLRNMTTGAVATSVSTAADMKPVSSLNPVQIGTKNNQVGLYLLPFNIYQIAVWDKALSADEIATQARWTRKALPMLAI